MRTLTWDSDTQTLQMIDQRLIPGQLAYLHAASPDEVADAIRTMAVRGAPAIGVSAAYGIALAAMRSQASSTDAFRADLARAAHLLKESRPTAVNLAWAVDRMLNFATNLRCPTAEMAEALLTEANRLAEEDIEINRRMAVHGAGLISDGDTIIHHCNTGSLAAVDWGTALGALRMAFEQGKRIHILVDETRPRLQGARLTAWELEQYGIPYEIITDNMAGYFLHSGQAQKVMFGADRVAANGDVANKIGSYMLALAADDNGVPVYSVFPTSTVDLGIADGSAIPIEERPADEVLDIQAGGMRVTPHGAKARNPAFDVTPHRLFTALVTENGVVYPPFSENLPRSVRIGQESPTRE